VTPRKEIRRIGHMMGPPFSNSSIGVASPRRNARGRLWMIILGRKNDDVAGEKKCRFIDSVYWESFLTGAPV
jgi:hypothetical protein